MKDRDYRMIVTLFQILEYIAFFCLFICGLVYGIYFLFVTKNSKTKTYLNSISTILAKNLNYEDLPKVSILMPVHNEEKAIVDKLINTSSFTYPREKIEFVLLDDCSTDNTVEVAKRAFEELHFSYKILSNDKKCGVNVSYNRGVKEATGDLIMTTDADIVVGPDALMNGVKILCSSPDIGGVTGGVTTVYKNNTASVKMETSYRTTFDNMLLTESAIDSTYPGYTGLAVVRKSVFKPLNQVYGSSDGNLSLSIIAQGFRFIFVPQLVFQEKIATNIKDQRRQKIRRGTRLVQASIIHSKELFSIKKRKFTSLIFPLKFLMTAVCPLLFLVGGISLFIGVFILSPLLAIVLVGLLLGSIFLGTNVSSKVLNLFSSFVFNQLYLVLALFFSTRKAKTWKAVARTT
jgi:poly-beta-1,6-N-acetyl-D-glucosamine synthase